VKCRASEEGANSIFTTSIGIAIYPNDGEGAGILMGNAASPYTALSDRARTTTNATPAINAKALEWLTVVT